MVQPSEVLVNEWEEPLQIARLKREPGNRPNRHDSNTELELVR
jgi:hypothetical protein